MPQEFLEYADNHPRCHISTDEEAMLIWGEDTGPRDATVLGFSYNSPTNWQSAGIPNALKILCRFANSLNLPLVWIGKENFQSGELELSLVELNGGDIEISPSSYSLEESVVQLMNWFGAEYDEMGTRKAVNKRTAGGFMDWSRDNMPGDYDKTDIDLLVSDDSLNPTAFVEVKRSYYSYERWEPFEDDIRNYVMQVNSSNSAGIQPIAIHQQKESIGDDSTVGYFKLNDTNPDARGDDWMDWSKEIITASESMEKLLSY